MKTFHLLLALLFLCLTSRVLSSSSITFRFASGIMYINPDFFIGAFGKNEYYCLLEMTGEILKLAEESKDNFESYLRQKYPLLGDIWFNLIMAHAQRPDLLGAFDWLQSPHISPAERERAASILLHSESQVHSDSDYFGASVNMFGIRPQLGIGPQSNQWERFTQQNASSGVGALMACDPSSPLLDFSSYSELDLEKIGNDFCDVPSNHCSTEEREALYARNDLAIWKIGSLDIRDLFQIINLAKYGTAAVINAQDPQVIRPYFFGPGRYFFLGFILVNACGRPADYEAWMDLLGRCGVTGPEYDALFGQDRLSEDQNLLIEHGQLRALVLETEDILFHSQSDIPVSLWYKAMKADLIAHKLKFPPITNPSTSKVLWPVASLKFKQYTWAYRLAKAKKDEAAMMEFAERAMLADDWLEGPEIFSVPTDPIFMKGLVEHTEWHKYIEYCFAYAVVYDVDEITALVFEKYKNSPADFQSLCQRIVSDGYLPSAYVPHFNAVAMNFGQGVEIGRYV